jgi:hypothetical protein
MDPKQPDKPNEPKQPDKPEKPDKPDKPEKAGQTGEARQAEIGEFEWRPGREAPAASGEERCPLPWCKAQVAAQLLAEGKPVRDIARTFKVPGAAFTSRPRCTPLTAGSAASVSKRGLLVPEEAGSRLPDSRCGHAWSRDQ